ncbi:MAG: rod shape-determining protein MreD [Clostridia bacterium]|nr:rod shape-determining protein MreD [Clostridia bacterium]
MKYVFHMCFLLLFSVIQPTLLEYAEIFGAKINLFLTYIVVVSCCCKKKEGAIVGFSFGLILDVLVGRIIGINAVMMMAAAFLVANFCEKAIRKNTLWITLLIVGVSTLMYELLYYIVAFLGNLEFAAVFLRILLPEILGGMIAALPLYFIVGRAARFLWNDKGESIG